MRLKARGRGVEVSADTRTGPKRTLATRGSDGSATGGTDAFQLLERRLAMYRAALKLLEELQRRRNDQSR